MKKFALAAITAAVFTGWTGMAVAVVDLDAGTGSVAYANELVVANTTQVAGVTTTNKLGFGVSAGQTRFIRYDFTNAKFVNAIPTLVPPATLTLTPPTANQIVSLGGAAGGTFVIFQITAAAGGNDQASPVAFNPGNLLITDKSAAASVKYTLYETASQAQSGGLEGRLATASGTIATFPSGLTFSAVPNSTEAEVAKLYTEFNNGVTTTLAKIGTVTYAPNQSVFNPVTGLALTAANMNLFTNVGTKLVLTGLDLAAAAAQPGGLFLAPGNDCNVAGLAGTNRTATTVDFVIDAAAVGTSPAAPQPATGRDLCFKATGTTPIAAQGFTVGSTVVAAPNSSTANAAPIAAGEFKRNGTVLKAAFADTTTASGVGMAVHMVNNGGIPAPYTVRCLLPTATVVGKPGTIAANTAKRESITGGIGCPADGTLRGIELTFAVPEGNVIGSIVRQNVTTGQASFDGMVGNK